jgi:tetratricopeptide (TPR) repeat protein
VIIHNARADLDGWRETGAEMLAIAERYGDPALLLQAHHAGWGNPCLGDFASQLEHTERGLAHYDPAQHSQLAGPYGGHDAGVCAHCHRAIVLFATGRPDRAAESVAAAFALADQLGQPLTRAHALATSCWLPAFRSEWSEAFRIADEGMLLSRELGMPTFTALAGVTRGWALVGLGRTEEGLAQIRDSRESGGLTAMFATLQAFHAEALFLAGATEEALRQLREALPGMERMGEQLWKANAMALEGDLMLSRGLSAEAEVGYRSALETARAQAARMWELRAATRLARLWQRQGKTKPARELLAPVHDWFTEGFDTADLKQAKALVDELA